jgi:hypothetical protein
MLFDLSLVRVRQATAQKGSDIALSRRSLLASSAFLALAAAPAVGPYGAWAATGMSADQRLTLIRMARDIYPHDDFLPDEPYVAAVDKILKEADGDAEVNKVVSTGLADLEARAQKTFGSAYAAISDPFKREALLRTIQMSGFFQKFRGELLMGIYDNKALWPTFGYEGSSWEKGGYIGRGFDDIDWL